MNLKFERLRDQIIFESLGDIRGKKILEIGCGTGSLSFKLLERGGHVKAIDIQDVFNHEHPLADKIDFEVMDVMNFNATEEFDLIISRDVIEHIKDDSLFIKSCMKLLKRDGKIITGTPHRWRTIHILKLLLFKRPQYPMNLGQDPELGPIIHEREYTIESFSSLFSGNQHSIIGCWLGLGPQLGIAIKGKIPFFPYHYLIGVCEKGN